MPANKPGLLRRIAEIMATCAQARAAAHHYEHLRSLSDYALAERGLTRADLSSTAFDRLSDQPVEADAAKAQAPASMPRDARTA